MVVADDEAARRHAGRREQCLDFVDRIRGRPCVGRADRHIGGNRAGSFLKPELRQSHHVGALRTGKTTTCMADEDNDGPVGFLNRDRMTQAIVVGNACRRRHIVGMRAGAEHDGNTNKRSRYTEGALALDG
jgi:hypothetical protein